MNPLEKEVVAAMAFQKAHEVFTDCLCEFEQNGKILKKDFHPTVSGVCGEIVFGLFHSATSEKITWLFFENETLPASFDLKNKLIDAMNHNLSYFCDAPVPLQLV